MTGNNTSRELLLDWLRDAHGMEKMALETLEKQASRTNTYPEIAQRVQEHVRETQWQADQVKGLIERLGGSTSSMKSGVGSLLGTMGAMFNSGAPDEVVKNCIGSYAIENFEIASYRSIIGAAEQMGETEVAQVCREILRQEEAMAAWLERTLPIVTQEYVQRREAGVEAKR